MGAGSSAAGSGIVVGLCLVFLGQQFGFFDLSVPLTGLLYLVTFSIAFAIVFGLLGIWLGARYKRKHSGLTAWQSKSAAPAAGTPGSEEK
jgi:positive regulator of sigma E activity